MDMGIQSAGGKDQAFTGQGFCGSAYGHSGSYPVHNCRVSGLADACDLSVFNSDICFVDPCIIQDQGVGDHQIQISVGAGGLYRLAHAVTEGLAAAEFALVPVGGVIFFYFNDQVCICQPYLIPGSGAVHHGIFLSGYFCAHIHTSKISLCILKESFLFCLFHGSGFCSFHSLGAGQIIQSEDPLGASHGSEGNLFFLSRLKADRSS